MADITFELIKKSLNASALRQKVIANNIANINTKGFKRSEVVFEDKLKSELAKIESNPESIDALQPQVITDKSTSFREDGNNIDLDLEMANMAANNIMYNMLVNRINSKFNMTRYIISEGRK